jgi:hypothetical protein
MASSDIHWSAVRRPDLDVPWRACITFIHVGDQGLWSQRERDAWQSVATRHER